MMNLKLGQKVKVIQPGNITLGQIGVIRHIKPSWYGIEFLYFSDPQLHNLEGRCPQNKGWYVDKSSVEPAVFNLKELMRDY